MRTIIYCLAQTVIAVRNLALSACCGVFCVLPGTARGFVEVVHAMVMLEEWGLLGATRLWPSAELIFETLGRQTRQAQQHPHMTLSELPTGPSPYPQATVRNDSLELRGHSLQLPPPSQPNDSRLGWLTWCTPTPC